MEGVMNAIHCVGRTEPWQYVEDAPIPQIKDDEVLIEIKACGICGTDHSLHRGQEALFNSYDITFLPFLVMSSLVLLQSLAQTLLRTLK